MASDSIVVLDRGRELAFSFEDMLRYHGGGSPGGVAHAFKVLEQALAILEPQGALERREITIETAFGGPGARDAFELVARAVTEDRFVLDASLRRPENGRAREAFVFRIRHGERAVMLALREGFVSDEFVDLTRRPGRTADQERRLTEMKAAMAERVMSARARDVYDVDDVAAQ